MATLVLGGIGAALGSSLTSLALGAAVGKVAGTMLGGAIDRRLFGNASISSDKALQDLNIQTMIYGQPIPEIYGCYKLAGNIIWATSIREHKSKSRHRSGKFSPTHTHIHYSYTISLAIAICHGPVSRLERIWADQTLLDKESNNIRFYNGDEAQMPDHLIEAFYGKNKAPAYRGLAYVVLQDFDLTKFDNHIPTFSFEISRSLRKESDVENMVQAVVMIPGSGEFVYDPKVQYYRHGDIKDGLFLQRGHLDQPINQHHSSLQANSLISLEQLKATLPNIRWISVVVTWFATDVDIGKCELLPGVEDRESYTSPDEWRVADWTRNEAYLISRVNDRPQYGGTINDESLVRYLTEIKRQGFQIMLYPIVMLDKPGKPWRGRIKGEAHLLPSFFKKYNNFILHYANLVTQTRSSPLVDAFIIGSEMIGVTTIRSDINSFPGVDEFISLAHKVKAIVGSDVKVSYAADWSEYHHVDSYYHLDPLWACNSIDFIGIDAYFPLTEAQAAEEITLETVIEGWTKGEGYDYYLENNHENGADIVKKPLSPAFAWKNIRWWWENYHINPNGQKTEWYPRCKKIWFTEYGFPSVDLATNQPNVFCDLSSTESGYPRGSNKNMDLSIQRLGIEATEKFWQSSDMVENKFLWTWDARPYPTWPQRSDIWGDSNNWEKGHWVQGKLGCLTLDKLISHLCDNIFQVKDIEVSSLRNIPIMGIALAQTTNLRQLLQILQKIYGFYIFEKDYKVFFQVKKPQIYEIPPESLTEVNGEQLPAITYNNHVYEKGLEYKIQYRAKKTLPSTVNLTFVKPISYQQLTIKSTLAQKGNNPLNLALPIVLTESQARYLTNNIYYNTLAERTIYSIPLNMEYMLIEIGDHINHDNQVLEVISKDIGVNKSLIIKALAKTHSTFSSLTEYYKDLYVSNKALEAIEMQTSETITEILDIPLMPFETKRYYGYTNQPLRHRILLANCGTLKNWPGCSIKYQNSYITCHDKAIIGQILSPLSKRSNYYIDNSNEVLVNILEGSLSSIKWSDIFEDNEEENLAVIGDEIIRFKKAELIQPYQYKLSGLIRGLYGSDVQSHNTGSRFILINDNLTNLEIKPSCNEINIEIQTLRQTESNSETGRKIGILALHRSSRTLPPHHVSLESEGQILKWLNLDLENKELFDEYLQFKERSIVTIVSFFSQDGNILHTEVCEKSYLNLPSFFWDYITMINKKGSNISESVCLTRQEIEKLV